MKDNMARLRVPKESRPGPKPQTDHRNRWGQDYALRPHLPRDHALKIPEFPGPPVPTIQKSSEQLKEEIWCLGFYFNPLKYGSRIDNFRLFHANIQKSTDNLLMVEIATHPKEFRLQNIHDRSKLIQIVDDGLLWQKERMFNIALRFLPPECRKIIWLDCDVIFDNTHWLIDTSHLLDYHLIVQPYCFCIRLPPDMISAQYIDPYKFPLGWGDESRSHGDIHAFYRRQYQYQWHYGWPGYAWAYNRALIQEHGFYDRCIGGSSDYLMAQAIIGDHDYRSWKEHYTKESMDYYTAWATKFNKAIEFNFNYVRRTNLFHLYHGPTNLRQYQERLVYLESIGFNHADDLFMKDNGCYGIVPEKEFVKEWFGQFYRKREDDLYRKPGSQ
jgi:hypothetical protein